MRTVKVIRNKKTGKIILLPDCAYETGDVIVVPLHTYDKKYFETVNRK